MIPLDDVLGRIKGLSPAEKGTLSEMVSDVVPSRWLPNPGPQTEAYLCDADVLLYGGQGGGGKTDLLVGLAFNHHQRSLLMRRQYTDLSAMVERAVEVNGGATGLNRSAPPTFRLGDGRIIEFGAAKNIGDEESWQGRPHDLIGFDEVAQFAESQVRFIMGWNRPATEGAANQRCRVVMASNPPLTSEGDWLLVYFRPWLDKTHPNPAGPGELRWFVTDPDGNDLEVAGPDDIKEWDGVAYIPKSRTFIPATLGDNPFLRDTGYQSTLDALPEPMRSAIRDGNFMAARQDHEYQLIPSQWVFDAQSRWISRPPIDVPMCSMGVDVARGGDNETVVAMRHDGWFAPLVAVPGRETPLGSDTAALVIKYRRDNCPVVVDMGGGYGGSVLEHLQSNGVPCTGYQGAGASVRRTNDRKLKFTNKRTEALWRFREALDPGQPGGSGIALPDDQGLVADLTAPRFSVTPQGIKAETKEELVKRLGRSTDRGDAVVMAWSEGDKHITALLDPSERRVMGHINWSRGSQSHKVVTRKPRR